jgi:hypothetical protein
VVKLATLLIFEEALVREAGNVPSENQSGVTEFQRRQLSAIKKELDQEYELVSTANLQRLQSTPNYLAAHRLDLGTGNIAQLG